MSCLEEQLQEIEALESVFDDERVRWERGEEGLLKGGIRVEFEPLAKKSTIYATFQGRQKRVEVSALPSATLHFSLPLDYPASSPELSLECIWMSQEMLSSVCQLLKDQCESMSGMPVLFFCLQSVVDAVRDQEAALEEICVDHTPWVKSKNLSGAEVMRLVADSSEKAEDHNFVAGCYDCEVCFENKTGRECVRITPCGHVYCAECVRCYIVEKTRGSQVQAITCLDASCKCTIPQAVIKNAIGEEEFDRYERILLENALGQMSDVVPCPRPSCQKSVVLSQLNTNLGSCEACGLSFCAMCKKTYHGLDECKFSSGDRTTIVKQWEEGSEEQRRKLAQRFGGMSRLQKVVDAIRNETWIEGNSKPCPKCKVSIEKNDGCNKMHCTKCDTNFCWLCDRILDKNNPYAHFNSDSGHCNNRLFEGTYQMLEPDFDDDDGDFWLGPEDDLESEFTDDDDDESVVFTDDESSDAEEEEEKEVEPHAEERKEGELAPPI